MNDLSEIIFTIKKPLLYASKNNFTNLDKVKDLEACVHTQTHKALDLPLEERVEGTAAAVAVAIVRGADIVRVHDVKHMVRIARMTDAIVRR